MTNKIEIEEDGFDEAAVIDRLIKENEHLRLELEGALLEIEKVCPEVYIVTNLQQAVRMLIRFLHQQH